MAWLFTLVSNHWCLGCASFNHITGGVSVQALIPSLAYSATYVSVSLVPQLPPWHVAHGRANFKKNYHLCKGCSRFYPTTGAMGVHVLNLALVPWCTSFNHSTDTMTLVYANFFNSHHLWHVPWMLKL